MDYRKIFDTIPEEFDKWRPRYCTRRVRALAKILKRCYSVVG